MNFKFAIVFIVISFLFIIILFIINATLKYCNFITLDIHKLKKIDKNMADDTLLSKFLNKHYF